MAKSKKTTGTATPDQIQDISHEVVQHSNGQQSVSAELMETVEDQIKHELAKFNVADQAIAALKEQYGALTIEGQDDKKGYEAVKKAWNDVRSKRTGLEKKGKELRGNFTVITKAIGDEEKRLIELISPLEDDLYTKWKAIDDEKERVKKEREEAEQKRLNDRLEEITALGMTFAGGFYQIGETISVDIASLRQFDDDQYQKLKSVIEAKKAELDKIEADRLEQQRQADEQRQKEADELKRQQDQLAQERAEMDRQRKELDEQRAEAARLKQENRTSQLVAIGMNRVGEKFIFNNDWNEPFEVLAGLVFNMESDDFAKYLESAKATIKEQTESKAQHVAQVEKEQAEKARREKYIAAALEAVGMTYDFSRMVFKFSTSLMDMEPVYATWNDFAGMTDEQIILKAQELGGTIDALKAAAKKKIDEKTAEAAKQEKLALGDRDRWFKDVAGLEKALSDIEPGTYKTAKFQKMATKLKADIDNILNLLK